MNIISDTNIDRFRYTAIDNLHGLLIFEINNFEFCIGLQCVREILEFKGVETVSRGRIISEIISSDAKYTLVNIHGILEFPNVSYSNNSRLILIDIFSKKFGFIVDKVIESISTTELFMDKTLDYALPKEEKQRFSGVLKFRNRRIMMLNLEKITREFGKVIEFPRRIKTSEYVDEEIKKKLKHVLGIA